MRQSSQCDALFHTLSSFWTGALFRGNSTETHLPLSLIPPPKRYYIYSGVIMRLLLIQHSKVDLRTSHTSINVEKKDWSEHPFSHKYGSKKTCILTKNTRKQLMYIRPNAKS